MSPLAVLTGIIMGSAVTIAIGLAMVLVVFLSLASEYANFAREYAPMLLSFGLFLGLSFVSSYAFIATLWERRWKWWAQGGMWFAIVVIAVHYWPTPGH
jgi:hypothetical protein